MSNIIDLNIVSDIIIETAKEEILPRFKNLKAEDIEQKSSPHDLVTTADKMAEASLKKKLTALIKGSLIVGEEETFFDPSSYERLKSDNYVWVIDPVDGTRSFSEGKDNFAVIVALVKNCETLAGFIYAPVFDKMIMGELGSGVYQDGKKLKVEDNNTLDTSIGIAKGSYDSFREKLKEIYWPRSGGISYLHLVQNKANFGIFKTKPLKPWDHAAGVMLHREAGGYSSMMDDTPYIPYPLEGLLFLAPSKEKWDYCKQFIRI